MDASQSPSSLEQVFLSPPARFRGVPFWAWNCKVTAEKIRIYKQLDSMSSEKEIDRFSTQLSDRFGTLPEEVDNLMGVVKIRNLGSALGFEKIIIKNGMMLFFFISNPLSPYFKSDVFKQVFLRAGEQPGLFTLKQAEGKLKIVSRGVDSIPVALSVLKKLQ